MYSHATSSENGPSSKSQTHGSHATSSENGPSSKSQTHGSHATSSENGPSSKSQTHGSHATSSENGPSSKSQTHGSHATSSENGPSSKSQTHGIFALHGRKKYGPLPNTENGRILRKGNSLSTNDLEEDTISAISCKQAVLKDAPDCIPQCLLSLPSKQTIGKTELYIQHERATESQLGDKFGASIETNSTRITGYCEHFFTDIAPGGVADHMKIKSGDQLVLLNGIFAPNFSHKEVLQDFSTIPVDAQTRLSLIILRSVSNWKPWKKTKWEWIDTSAILIPDYQEKELPAVEKLVYSTSHGSSHEERGLFKLKVQGTQIYVTISDGLVGLEVSDSGGDVDRFNIWVWTRCALDESTGQILYTACLYKKDPHNQYKNNYVNVSNTTEIITKADPQWFVFGLLGKTQSFKDKGRNKWLGCDVTAYAKSGKFCLQKHPFFFAAYAVAETDRRESSIGLNTNNEGTDVDASYFSVYRSSAYGSKQSVSADSGYGTDGGVIQE